MKKPDKSKTPFERLTEFTRSIVGVPKSEIDKKALAFQQRKKKRPAAHQQPTP